MSVTGLSRRIILSGGLGLAASALLAPSALGRGSGPVTAPRGRLLFDFGWKFTFGNGTDPSKDLGFGSGQNDFAKQGFFKFARLDFDDSKWRSLNLTHDWAVELPFVHDNALTRHGSKPLGRRFPETSVGWYRREFEIPAGDLGRRITVEFDGAFQSSLVFVNGCFIGRSESGYAPFHFDITDFLNYGEKNVIAVRVDASLGEGWFYEGAGIYRQVWLNKTNPVHFGDYESTVRSTLHENSATLSLATVVENQGKNVVNARVTWKVLNAAAKIVASAETSAQSIGVDQYAAFDAKTTFANPALWSVDAPNLYSAIATVESGGDVFDAQRVTFGLRSAVFDPDKGFFLNGKPLKIQGTCNHQDHAGVGVALPDRLQSFRLAVLKDMGCNAVPTAHNMPTPEWVEACDRMGMMMMCETRQMSSNPEAMAQFEAMIKRYRNSPSIIIWSIGNEEDRLQTSMAEEGAKIAGRMVQRCHELDPTRVVSAAVNGRNDKGVSDPLDIVGFNYHLDYPDNFHKNNPERPLYGSETASVTCTRGVYTTDTKLHTVDAYDHPPARPGAETAEMWWTFYDARTWEAGGFAWTGFDYRGEPTPYGWPSISSQFGIVDTCGFPKDSFYYYKACWDKKPLLHLFPHWNFEGKEGEQIPVWVYSNLDKIELFLNGASLGSQKVPRLGHMQWSVKYEPGTIEARGSKDDRVVLTEKHETTGAAVAIRLTADRTEVNADGEDVSLLKVEAVDREGRPVPTANHKIAFNISGDGLLIGVGNGDPNCQESDKQPSRSLFNGLAQAIVQSTKVAGEIRVGATAPELDSATIVIRTRKAKSRPAVPVVSES
jgi:beta-galactosidase